MASKAYLTDSSLQTFLNTNTRLRDFITRKQLVCRPNRDGLTFCFAGDNSTSTASERIVTVWWTREVTQRLKIVGTESFPEDLDDFCQNKNCKALTTLLAYSIMALYLAASTAVSSSKHIKTGFPKLGNQEFKTATDIVPRQLREAVKSGTIPIELAKQAFSFTMTMLPSHVVDGNISPQWVFPQFDELADVSYVWLRTRWTAWSIVYQFHKAAPCGECIYAWAGGGQETKPLNVQIKSNSLAVAAMHDGIYPEKADCFKNRNILDVVCKDKT